MRGMMVVMIIQAFTPLVMMAVFMAAVFFAGFGAGYIRALGRGQK